jgi:integrase
MASILKLDGRWRALVRKAGVTRCKTFDTKGAANTWATKVEHEIDGYRATGKFSATKVSIGALIRQPHHHDLGPKAPAGQDRERPTRAVADLRLVDLHFHDMRHEAISRFFKSGLRIEQVALISGHRDWAQFRRYTHVQAEDMVSA